MKRVQMRRGVKLPPGAKYVGRPTRWGNPWSKPLVDDALIRHAATRLGLPTRPRPASGGQRHRRQTLEPLTLTRPQAIALYRRDASLLAAELPGWIDDLRGFDLACYCPLDQPCHADVLLELIGEAA